MYSLTSQVFTWEGDQRKVVTVPKRSCALAPNGVVLAKTTDSPRAVELNYTGTFFFTSSLDQQCAEGSLFAVSVTPSNETTGMFHTTHALVLIVQACCCCCCVTAI